MTRAQAIVDTLLEDDSLDSLEGAEPWDYSQALKPGTEQYRLYRLQYDPPRNADEARGLGVNWFIRDGRKYTFDTAYEPGGYPRKSHTIATNRNLRRRSFGYTDVYSTRQRNWPTPSRKSFYRRQDRQAVKPDQSGAGI